MEEYNYHPEFPEQTTLNVNDISIQLYIVENNIWLFSNRQLAKNYNISENTVSRHLQRNKNTLIEGKHWFKKRGWKPPYYPDFTLWTKDGFIKFGNFVKNTKADKLLTTLGVKSRQTTKIESEIIEIIKNTFKGIAKVETHFPVSGYIVDIYFPELDIIIEIDEMGHESYDLGDEYLREILVKSSLNCEVIHFNPHDHSNNIGKVINKIIRKIMKT